MIGQSAPSPVTGLSAQEAASYWLQRIDAGPLSDIDQIRFDAWLAMSPRNAEAYDQAEALLKLFDDAGGDSHLDALRTAALAAGPEPRRGIWLGAGMGIAAALLAMVTLGGGMLHPLRHSDPATVTAATSLRPDQGNFVTARGERRTVTLADGSTVTLDTDSAIRVAFAPERRLIRLVRGRALFEVAKNRAWPFTVQAGDRQVTALGTVFEVRLDPHRMKVLLVEGKVVVDGIRDEPRVGTAAIVPTVLRPGQELSTRFGAPQRLASVDVERQLQWREGFIEFDDIRLADAVDEMNRYSATQIVIRDPATADLRLSGLFRTGNVTRFAAVVGELLPVHAVAAGPARIALSEPSPAP